MVRPGKGRQGHIGAKGDLNEGGGTVRGFLKGVSLGGVIAVGGIGVLSQLAGPEAVRSPQPQGDQVAPAIPSQKPETPPEVLPEVTQIPVTDSAAPPQTAAEQVETPADVAVEAAPDVAPEQAVPAEVEPSPEQVATETPETPSNQETPANPEPTAPPEASANPDATATPKPTVIADALTDTPPVVVTEAPLSPEGNGPVAAPIGPTAGSDAPPIAQVGAAPVLPADADATIAAPSAPVEPPARPSVEPPADQLASADTGVGAVAAVPNVSASTEPSAALPLAPGPPMAEAAPQAAELPPPPPLTAEEEALLKPLPEAVAEAPDATSERAPTPQAQVTEAQDADVPSVDAPAQAEPPAVLAVEPAAPLPRTQGLTDQAQGVVTGRLPRIGVEDPAAETAAESDSDIASEEAMDLPPLQRFARSFENPDAKPLFAILLVDDGKDGVNRSELATLSLPLTIVIDPLSEGAAERAAIWRSGGQEVVLAATGIPAGATASDLEQTFQLLLERLPEALAVIDPDGRIFQDNRPLASMVVPLIQAEGMGLVTFDRGLNAADQVARREGVGAARIFRILDAEGEAAPVIRRYLDRAAFKAAQEGQVSVIGDLRSETVKAIMEWAVEGRSATVALAPVSALMRR